MSLASTARNALRPGYLPVMARKVYERARYGRREADAARAWAARETEDMDAWARSLDARAWGESLAFAAQMKVDVQPRLDELDRAGIHMGGGGCYELLHFLARTREPAVVLETGVAAGWSTRALLSAIRENGAGHLYSSDFPYFRIEEPDRFVGYLVPDELKGPWTLFLGGDRRNLDRILADDLVVDLVHYDSDKSRGGREFFVRRIARHLRPTSTIVMDDINDDLFFRDYSAARASARVFAYNGKFIGLIGP